MKPNDSFIISRDISFNGGFIPLGAVLQIKEIINKDSIILVSITPFIINNNRQTLTTSVDAEFIKNNASMIKK